MLKSEKINDYLRYLCFGTVDFPPSTDYMKNRYFGKDKNVLDASISRAYLDFNRTIHGIGSSEDNYVIKNNAVAVIKIEVEKLLKVKIINQELFDKWHNECCYKIMDIFENMQKVNFYYGQSQKWINMTFKYLIIQDFKEVQNVYDYLHIPIDNIIIENLIELEKSCKISVPKLTVAWSRLDYQEYFNFQKWFRDTFNGIPIENEFDLWLHGSKSLENKIKQKS